MRSSSCATSAASTSRSPGSAPTRPSPSASTIEAEKVGDGWLVIPANRGQVVAPLDVTLRRRAGPLVDAVGPAQRRPRSSARRAARRARRRPREVRGGHDRRPGVRRAEAERARRSSPRRQQAARRRSRSPCPRRAATSRSSRSASTRSSRAASPCRTRSRRTTAPPAKRTSRPPPASRRAAARQGQARATSATRRAATATRAVDFWKTTVHAQAWKTLVDRGQQFDYRLHRLSRHRLGAAGRLEPRAQRAAARRQCETCHGPGSIHVAKGGDEKPLAIVRAPARGAVRDAVPHEGALATRSSTTAYLRDIVGPGHGEERAQEARRRPDRRTSCARPRSTRRAATLGAGCVRLTR